MSMYRIKRVISYMSNGTTEVKYIPQRKLFYFWGSFPVWRNFRQSIDLSFFFESERFETQEEAIAFLKEIKTKVKRDTSYIEVNL